VSREVPKRLWQWRLIRVEESGKEPVTGPTLGESLRSIRWWLDQGGNVGVSPRPDDDLLILDVEAEDVVPLVGEAIGVETFLVKTGGGLVHVYFRCPDWGRGNLSVGNGDEELLSVRADNHYVVTPPSIHPDTGERYSVLVDTEIAEVSASTVAAFVERVEEDLTGDEDGDGDGERRDRGEVSSADLDELDELIRHDEYRAEVREILRDREAGHDRRVWLAGFLLDGVGLSVSETVRIIDKFNRWNNYDRSVTESQVESVDRSTGGRSR